MSWQRVKLSECAQIVSGATPSTTREEFWNGSICWATPKDLSGLDSHYLRSTPRQITEAGLHSCSAEILPAGSVLFSSRAPIGHTAINSIPMATNQGFKSFVPHRDKLDAKFLLHWLRANRERLEALGNGATFKELSGAAIARGEIPLPPLPEQRRIAAILDHADALRAKRRAAIAKLDSLAQSIFLDMFGDPLTNPRKWPEAKVLSDVAEIASGITIGRKVNGAPTQSVPYLAVVNVQDRFLNMNVCKYVEATVDEIRKYALKKHDLLLTEGGDPDKLGRGTLWNEELPECIHQNHVFRVRLTSPEVDPHFLNWLVGSRRGKHYFLQSAKQTTGIASINATQLRNFPLMLPPLTLQRKFSATLAGVKFAQAQYDATERQTANLVRSIQNRAFQGTL